MINSQFSSYESLLDMNGHGIFVWGVFFIFLIVIFSLSLFYKIKIKNFQKRNHEIN